MPEVYEKHLEKAREAVKKKNYDFAIALYLEVLMMAPDHEIAARELRAVEVRKCQEEGKSPAGSSVSGARSALTKVFRKVKKDHDKEIMAYEGTLKKFPYNIMTLMKLAETCAKAGYTKRAIVNYETVIDVESHHPEANKALGKLYKGIGELIRAEKCYQRVLSGNPHDPDATRAIKDIAADSSYKELSAKGDSYRDKLKSKKEAVKLEEKEHIIRTKDDFEKALQLALEEIEENPSDSKRYRKVGDLYNKHKDYKNALAYYKKAAEVNPQDMYAKDKISDIQMARYEAMIKKASDAYRNDPSEENLKSLEEVKKQKQEFSIKEYERRVENHPTDTALRFELGVLYFNTERFDDAISQLQKTVNDPKVQMRAHYYLGRSFVSNQHYELGISEFQKALSDMSGGMTDQKKEIVYSLARTYEVTNKSNEALEEYRKILAEDYSYKDVKQRVAEIQEKVKEN